MKSLTLHAALLALLAGVTVANAQERGDPEQCFLGLITGYASSEYPGRTADGTPTPGNEWQIAATHPRIPLGSVVWVDGIGELTVRDRGYLGWNQVDVLTRTRAEAFALTSYRQACWWR